MWLVQHETFNQVSSPPDPIDWHSVSAVRLAPGNDIYRWHFNLCHRWKRLVCNNCRISATYSNHLVETIFQDFCAVKLAVYLLLLCVELYCQPKISSYQHWFWLTRTLGEISFYDLEFKKPAVDNRGPLRGIYKKTCFQNISTAAFNFIALIPEWSSKTSSTLSFSRTFQRHPC